METLVTNKQPDGDAEISWNFDNKYFIKAAIGCFVYTEPGKKEKGDGFIRHAKEDGSYGKFENIGFKRHISYVAGKAVVLDEFEPEVNIVEKPSTDLPKNGVFTWNMDFSDEMHIHTKICSSYIFVTSSHKNLNDSQSTARLIAATEGTNRALMFIAALWSAFKAKPQSQQ